MNPADERARQSLARYQRENPDATALARLASLAVRIEPQLLRRLRTELLPDADVGTEADLWFSPLIESRGSTYVTLDPRVAHCLRESFNAPEVAGPGRAQVKARTLARAIAITREAHRGAAATLRLEEALIALAVLNAPECVVAIDRALRPALRQLHEGGPAANDVAHWALGAFARFHPTVWRAPNAIALRLAAHLRLGLQRGLDQPANDPGQLGEAAWVLPAELLEERVRLGVEFVAGGLRFREAMPNESAIELPPTKPLVVTLAWQRGSQRFQRLVEASPGQIASVDVEVRQVELFTLAGDAYRVAKTTAGGPARKKCFVIMGFGKKTDYATSRTLDLDKTYRKIIKKAVEEAGLECIRADEVIHSGTIDQPLYELLLEADVVVADLSTSDANTIYELGVRHALRPNTTIVIAEKQFRSPFDPGSLLVRPYEHHGNGIDAEEADRMREELQRAITTALDRPIVDSPVHTFLATREAQAQASLTGAGSAMAADAGSPEAEGSRPTRKTCFVSMGFGEKTDYATGRTLDLDMTYRVLIKTAVEDAGLECIRADEVIHSGTIDKPLYELLLEADVVVADLSTSDAIAIYQLGVRHALRPNTTIVIADQKFQLPFDFAGLHILRYEHLGRFIDSEEAASVRGQLRQAIRTLLLKPVTDSPVYTFLPQLKPPFKPLGLRRRDPETGETTANLTELLREARMAEDFGSMRKVARKLLEKRPGDEHVLRQLALATYKSKKPDPLTALGEARQILLELKPATTRDPETLNLWGAVHKRLYEMRQDSQDLDAAIEAYENSHRIKPDYSAGSSLAFLLAVRSRLPRTAEGEADLSAARRVWTEVVQLCNESLAAGVKDEAGRPAPAQTFWIRATLVEALIGSGDERGAQKLYEQLASEAPETWMMETLKEQLDKIGLLLSGGSSPSDPPPRMNPVPP